MQNGDAEALQDRVMPEVQRIVPRWSPPTTLHDADEQVVSLTNDIGLIMAHLAERRETWCERTGRPPTDFQIWRRRALLAKTHKEAQLRECKRIRRRLTNATMGEGAGADSASDELRALCRRALAAWRASRSLTAPPLDQALIDLSQHFERQPHLPLNGDVPG